MSAKRKSTIKTAAIGLCLFLAAVVVGALLDIYVFQFSDWNNKTEQEYLREVQQSGVTQELAVGFALEVARQGGWEDEKDAVTNLAVYLKVCLDQAISDRINSNSAESTRRVSVESVAELTQWMTGECVEKLADRG